MKALQFHTPDSRGRFLCNQDGIFHFGDTCPNCGRKIEARKEQTATMPPKRVFHVVSTPDKKILRKIECWCKFTADRFASEQLGDNPYVVVEVK